MKPCPDCPTHVGGLIDAWCVCETCGGMGTIPADRGRDVSSELAEVRTVHSRAVTALETLVRLRKMERTQWHSAPDPEAEEMEGALQDVVGKLERWKRARARRRR